MSSDRSSLARMDSRDAMILAALAIAFAISRLLWISESVATAYYWEEAYRLIAASEILAGPVQPLFEYQADHYQGGSLVMIWLVMGVFLLFGEGAVAGKLSALLFSTASLCMLYILGRKVFGRTTGLVAALAYLAGPPLVAYWGLTVMGFHGESTLFSLVEILIFFEIRAGRWRTPAGWGLLGLVAGLGLWFCYTSGLTLIACGVAWLLLEGLPRPREIASATVGGMLGLVPWLVYNLRHEFLGLTRVFQLFGVGNPIDPWVAQGPLEKAVSLFSRDFPVGLITPYPEALPDDLGSVLRIAGAVPLAVALVWSAWRVGGLLRRESSDREARRRELVFVVYGLVFLGVFLGSRFTVNPVDGIISYRLFVPPAVLLLLPAASGVARAWRRGGLVRHAGLVGCLLCIGSFAVATAFFATREIEPLRRVTEIGYMARGVLLHHKYEDRMDRAVEAARLVEAPHLRFKVFEGLGWGVEYRFEKEGSLENVKRQIQALPIEERVAFVSGLRWATRMRRERFGHGIEMESLEDGDRIVLERILQLRRFANGQWNQIPAESRSRGRRMAR
jgi:4-amino-4-deoxy-L-arabinose transferase-like glycosyltransferase